MENSQVAAVFDEIADILDIQGGNDFRVRSYRNAARSIRDHPERIQDLVQEGQDLSELPDIGKSIAAQIQEIVHTGSSSRLAQLKQHFPPELSQLLAIPHLGPKRIKQLNDALGIQTLDGLRQAAQAHQLQQLPGLGQRSEEKILRGLEQVSQGAGRILLLDAQQQLDALGDYLSEQPSISRWAVAGSLRRCRETIGDLDLLLVAESRDRAAGAILAYPALAEVIAKGQEKISLRLDSGLQVDFRLVSADSFGAAMIYFTGSKAHNIALRKRAGQRKLKLNEYGLFSAKRRLAGASEKEMYAALELDVIPPELREDRGEIEAAEAGTLPRLIEQQQIRGDLHAHTKASDGRHTLVEMAQAAQELGYQYLAITDHSQAVAVTRGLDEMGLRRHAAAIRELDGRLDDLWLLAGIEVDILKDGALDLPEKALAELDWVVASVHSYFELPEREMTQRLLRAIESGVVHCLGHPLARQLGAREAIRFDVDRVFAACKEQHVCLEINAHPERLDLPDVYAKKAKEAGVKLVIATDAHKNTDLRLMHLGVAVARRGWLTKDDVLNTKTAKQLRRALRRG